MSSGDVPVEVVDEGGPQRNKRGQFLPGNREGAGARKGRPNRFSKKLLDDVALSYQERGGIEYLKRLADEEPQIFTALLAKVLGNELKVALLQEQASIAEKAAQAGVPVLETRDFANVDGALAQLEETGGPEIADAVAKLRGLLTGGGADGSTEAE